MAGQPVNPVQPDDTHEAPDTSDCSDDRAWNEPTCAEIQELANAMIDAAIALRALVVDGDMSALQAQEAMVFHLLEERARQVGATLILPHDVMVHHPGMNGPRGQA